MKQNLDTLKDEIEQYLASKDVVVFHGFARPNHGQSPVFWDTDHYPDFRLFVDVANRAGAKMILYSFRHFSRTMVDDAIERLGVSELPREEQRGMERRLRELRGYDGFTCSLELSFDCQGRLHVFDLRTEWYEELLEILDEIDTMPPEDEDDDEEAGPMGEYFSRN
jgi:hypothetical protein